jgi:hypothetical protein
MNWFTNVEDRVFKGADYQTKEEDTYKLLKFLRANTQKHDFYRYDTNPETEFVRSIIISTAKMKEQYLIYRESLMICPCLRNQQNNRFNMMPLVLYGVNSHGRNQIFAFCLVKEDDRDSIIFALK